MDSGSSLFLGDWGITLCRRLSKEDCQRKSQGNSLSVKLLRPIYQQIAEMQNGEESGTFGKTTLEALVVKLSIRKESARLLFYVKHKHNYVF
ncbi:hypothetical protein L1987_52932 [Smallanthus sonchifolius]|uniref:Uncharacterized protein n=1 Tax=Smallanthus sonchifolius TaxID=185202 RepID=A0ACB9EUH9_9ASTR|nr:hypothetical protein L1987_52932 [Smallanthus sonchifolius]